MCAKGIIEDQEAEAELRALAADMETLEKRRHQLFERQVQSQQLQNQGLEVATLIQEIKNQIEYVDAETRRAVTQLLVERIIIYTYEDPGDDNRRKSRVEVKYRFFPQALYESESSRRCLSAMKNSCGIC
jgi:hypothetical protein